jgi:hypothetical protein
VSGGSYSTRGTAIVNSAYTGTWSKLAGLTLTVDAVDLVPLSLHVSATFERPTTLIRLSGAGERGVGEDVCWDTGDQQRLRQAPIEWPRGEFDLASYSVALDGIDLNDSSLQLPAYRDYRRWGIESAALDLALRQAGLTLAQVLERRPAPVRFVASTSLGEPPSLDLVKTLLGRVPGLRFKLDAHSGWSQAFLDRLAALDVVDVIDFKGAYKGTPVDTPPDATLYGRVAETLPEAVLEDPAWTEETAAALAPYQERVAWDAPIHSVEDIETLPFAPRLINMKPSRFGRLKTLFDTYDYCTQQGIAMYGGGQFELGEGRRQIQTLAALFHADAGNDVAPVEYHEIERHDTLPTSPRIPVTTNARPGFAMEWK